MGGLQRSLYLISANCEDDNLMDNPFRYEDSVIAVQAFYIEMLSRDLRHLQSDSGFLVVSALDPKHSMAKHDGVLLAGTVTGVYQLSHGLTVPLLTLRAIHVCQIKECKDIIPDDH